MKTKINPIVPALMLAVVSCFIHVRTTAQGLGRIGMPLADTTLLERQQDARARASMRMNLSIPDVLSATNGPLIDIRARFVEMPEQNYAELSAKWSPLSQSGSNGWTRVLTAIQTYELLRELKSKPAVDIFTEPRVATESGRQAHIQMVDWLPNTYTLTTTVTNGVTNFVGQPEPIRFGPVLDVTPSVLADGYTINLKLIPTVTEFLGYDNPNEVLSAGVLPQDTVLLPTLLPRFRVRQVSSTVNVWDGQTIVLGGLRSESAVKILTEKEPVPVLGDLPLLGRFFRSESKNASKKNLLIFVTPTLIDPTGNPIHTEEEMPFARDRVPPQPAR